MEFKVDKENPNILNVYDNDKLIKTIIIPNYDISCQIFDLNNELKLEFYNKFNGLIIFTWNNYRELYFDSKLVLNYSW